jgi:hypothetical protein
MINLLLRIKRFCGYAVGFVFFISGLLKLMDPVGAGLVMKEYFTFLHMGFLSGAGIAFGVIFALAEAFIGAALITGVWKKPVALAAIALQGFFTLLTLALVIFNPEMDCGCFGEAIHLTHSQTFIKNIILLGLLLIYYIPSKHLNKPKAKKYVSFGLVTVSTAAFALYSLLYIPMVDFTALKSGIEVNREAYSADNSYEAVFVYSKDGQEQTFSLDDIPDSTWTFVRTETVSQPEVLKPATAISIYDKDGQYADSLLTAGRILVISAYDKISEKEAARLSAFAQNAIESGFMPLMLTASKDITAPEGITRYFCDYKTLITLNRSNGGVTYIDGGLIIRKWAKRNLPDLEDLTDLSDMDATESYIERDSKTSLAFQGFLLYVFAVMLLL